MDLTNFVTATEASKLAKCAINRMVNSEEYVTIMKNIQNEILYFAESGSHCFTFTLKPIDIPAKFDEVAFKENIVNDLHKVGFNVKTTDNISFTVCW